MLGGKFDGTYNPWWRGRMNEVWNVPETVPDSEIFKFEEVYGRLRNQWIIARDFRVAAPKVCSEYKNLIQRNLEVAAIQTQ